MNDPVPRQRKLGRYELLDELGSGSFATVYRARLSGAHGFAKAVALKVIHARVSRHNIAEAKALINEARLCGHLKHHGIVDVYDFGEARGRLFIAMEFVDGLTVAELIARMRAAGTDLPIGTFLLIAHSVADALAYAHDLTDHKGRRLGVVHRDLKPQNIMVASSGGVKILDFGIARSTAALFHTADSMPKGTPAYMSPEQVQGIAGVDARADLFALGAVLLELFTLQPVFLGDGLATTLLAVLERDLSGPLERVAEQSEGLAELLGDLLQRDRDQRPSSASDVAERLRRLSHDHPAELTVADLVRQVRALPRPELGVDLASTLSPIIPEPPSTDTMGIVTDDLLRSYASSDELSAADLQRIRSDSDEKTLPVSFDDEEAIPELDEAVQRVTASADTLPPVVDGWPTGLQAGDGPTPALGQAAIGSSDARAGESRRMLLWPVVLAALLVLFGFVLMLGPTAGDRAAEMSKRGAASEPIGSAAVIRSAEPGAEASSGAEIAPDVGVSAPAGAAIGPDRTGAASPGGAGTVAPQGPEARGDPSAEREPVPGDPRAAGNDVPESGASPGQPAASNLSPDDPEQDGESAAGEGDPVPQSGAAALPAERTVFVSSKPWAEVSVGGRVLGTTPLRGAVLGPEVGELVLTCPSLSGKRKVLQVTAAERQVICWDFNLDAPCPR